MMVTRAFGQLKMKILPAAVDRTDFYDGAETDPILQMGAERMPRSEVGRLVCGEMSPVIPWAGTVNICHGY